MLQYYAMAKEGATDNAFIERLWRSVKYEKVYVNPPEGGKNIYGLLTEYSKYYNQERRHSSINNQRPMDVYIERLKVAA